MKQQTFNTKLSGVVRSLNTSKVNIQELIEAGFAQYEEHGNTVYLTALVNKVKATKAAPLKTITAYIAEQANVKWQTRMTKLGKVSGYVKAEGKATPAVNRLDEAWYDWAKGGHNAVTEVKVESSVLSLVKRLEAAMDKGTVDNRELAEKAVETLRSIKLA